LVFVKFWQKRIIGKSLQNGFRIKIFRQFIGQSGFSCANISFNRNIIEMVKLELMEWDTQILDHFAIALIF
jgi:hypothetical protein